MWVVSFAGCAVEFYQAALPGDPGWWLRGFCQGASSLSKDLLREHNWGFLRDVGQEFKGVL